MTTDEMRFVRFHAAIDALLSAVAFLGAAFLRFGTEADLPILVHWQTWMLGVAAFPGAFYLGELYSIRSAGCGWCARSGRVLLACLVAILFMIAVPSFVVARPLGRGVILLGGSMTFLFTLVHQLWLGRTLRAKVQE